MLLVAMVPANASAEDTAVLRPRQVATAPPADGQAAARARWFTLWAGQKRVNRLSGWTTPSRKSKRRVLQAIVKCSSGSTVGTWLYHKVGGNWRLKKVNGPRACNGRPIYTRISDAKVGRSYRLFIGVKRTQTVKAGLQNYG
ncbi:hypothetical protein [Actinomadura rubrisoli]|uniref:Uncharacterized protein n=1 Tax=Actinomadura rubrisoli TaxID=2530368 RepID=A0A4V2YYH0_9ACTN|nr:hypothetical protein [Actinomadura rubrisoli]TDD93017.1 hypothetical protein E1298_10400 [Actinomadura rubrisoli]